jgi:hypothetical protein
VREEALKNQRLFFVYPNERSFGEKGNPKLSCDRSTLNGKLGKLFAAASVADSQTSERILKWPKTSR